MRHVTFRQQARKSPLKQHFLGNRCNFPPRIYLPNVGFSQQVYQKFTGTGERPHCSASDLDPRQLAPGCFQKQIPCSLDQEQKSAPSLFLNPVQFLSSD